MTKSTNQGSHACLNSCQWHQWEPHWLWKGQVCNWIFLASFHGEWMSVSQSKATLFKYSRPHEEVTNESTTTGWKHAPDVSSMRPSSQHEAMLHGLPYQGIVLSLLPFLPSPHRCIKWSASIWRGYDLLFFANLVIHSTDKLLFTRKHQWWARSAWLPDKVMCNIPSLPSYSVVVRTQGLFQVISRPFGLVCEEPLFEVSRWIPARSPRH